MIEPGLNVANHVLTAFKVVRAEAVDECGGTEGADIIDVGGASRSGPGFVERKPVQPGGISRRGRSAEAAGIANRNRAALSPRLQDAVQTEEGNLEAVRWPPQHLDLQVDARDLGAGRDYRGDIKLKQRAVAGAVLRGARVKVIGAARAVRRIDLKQGCIRAWDDADGFGGSSGGDAQKERG